MLPTLQVRHAGLQLSGGHLPHARGAFGTTPTGPGKRPRRPLGVAAAGSNLPMTMTIWDYTSQRHFLADSGADESLVPATAKDQSLPRSQSLMAANGTEIATFGRRELLLSFAPGHRVVQSFWIADVKRPILGADFFIEHCLLIDLKKRRLLDATTARPFQGRTAPSPAISGLHRSHTGPYEALLAQFPDLLVQKFGTAVKHRVRHYIPTTGPPLHARARQLDGAKLAAA